MRQSVLESISKITLLSVLSIGSALASSDWSGMQDETNVNSDIDLDVAEELPALETKELRRFRPTHRKLPQNPYAQTDYTAYTLEWGEVKLGVGHMTAGLLPRTQVGISPSLQMLGIRNANAKVNLLRLGPVDVAAEGHTYRLPIGDDFMLAFSGVGGMTSLRIMPRWSLHAGARYSVITAKGSPDLSLATPFVARVSGLDLSSLPLEEIQEHLQINAKAHAVTARVATDIRINRRDSFVIQGQGIVWGGFDTGHEAELPEVLDVGANVPKVEDGPVALTDAYMASISYQLAWKRLELRVGGGISSVPGAWLLQSTEISYRLGGKTRWTENRMMRNWRSNKRDLNRAPLG